jgi:hypothetical protein
VATEPAQTEVADTDQTANDRIGHLIFSTGIVAADVTEEKRGSDRTKKVISHPNVRLTLQPSWEYGPKGRF